jgi:Nucleotidyl transferase AbiEii toxin, Type IV TA system
MESLGFGISFESMATRFLHKKHLDMAPVDLLWVSAESFAKMATTGQKTGRHGNIPVIDFKALLAMKIHALKDDKERKGKDVLDIRFILAENPHAITDEQLRELCERYSGPDAYNYVRMTP